MNHLKNLLKSNKKAGLAEEIFKINETRCDLIGPADKISNIRQYKFFKPENESKLEYDYRIMRENVLAWNQEYWTQQNLKFIHSKRSFLENLKKSKQIETKMESATFKINQNKLDFKDDQSATDSNEMNEFYKAFLNESYQNHYEYNKKWFKLNLQLLWPAARVYFHRLNRHRK